MIGNRLLLITILALFPLSAAAQSAVPVGQGDIAQLTRSLDGLIQSLKAQQSRNDQAVELQKLEIAISYLNFRSRRIEAKEKELQVLKENRDRMKEILSEIKAQAEQREEDSKELRDLQPKQPSIVERFIQPAQWQQRIDRLDSEIITLESEIRVLSTNLAELDSYVKKNLILIP